MTLVYLILNFETFIADCSISFVIHSILIDCDQHLCALGSAIGLRLRTDDRSCIELPKMRAPIKSPPYADKENYRAKILSAGECGASILTHSYGSFGTFSAHICNELGIE
jgi:hypothetical protein